METVDPNTVIKQFDPIPSQNIQKKFDYFYLPYSPLQERGKHMEFEGQAKGWENIL